MKFQYPLQWLNQQPRTKNPQRANFGNHSSYKAGIELEMELKRLGSKNVILSSDMQSKQDGTLCVRQYKAFKPSDLNKFKWIERRLSPNTDKKRDWNTTYKDFEQFITGEPEKGVALDWRDLKV